MLLNNKFQTKPEKKSEWDTTSSSDEARKKASHKKGMQTKKSAWETSSSEEARKKATNKKGRHEQFICTECGNSYVLEITLERHMKAKHPKKGKKPDRNSPVESGLRLLNAMREAFPNIRTIQKPGPKKNCCKKKTIKKCFFFTC